MEILETNNQDIRWKQRFQNYEKAFHRLSRAIEIVRITPDDDLLQSGLVQTYEYTFELAWKTLKDYLEMEGFLLRSPRETIRQGFQSGYITNAEDWLQALADRNLTVHIYDDEIIVRVLRDIYERYFFILQEFYTNFKARADELQESILFGSRAKGNFKPGSDIDLAVKGPVSKDTLSALLTAFEESLLPYFVDVVIYEHITNEALREHIDRVGISIYKS